MLEISIFFLNLPEVKDFYFEEDFLTRRKVNFLRSKN